MWNLIWGIQYLCVCKKVCVHVVCQPDGLRPSSSSRWLWAELSWAEDKLGQAMGYNCPSLCRNPFQFQGLFNQHTHTDAQTYTQCHFVVPVALTRVGWKVSFSAAAICIGGSSSQWDYDSSPVVYKTMLISFICKKWLSIVTHTVNDMSWFNNYKLIYIDVVVCKRHWSQIHTYTHNRQGPDVTPGQLV